MFLALKVDHSKPWHWRWVSGQPDIVQSDFELLHQLLVGKWIPLTGEFFTQFLVNSCEICPDIRCLTVLKSSPVDQETKSQEGNHAAQVPIPLCALEFASKTWRCKIQEEPADHKSYCMLPCMADCYLTWMIVTLHGWWQSWGVCTLAPWRPLQREAGAQESGHIARLDWGKSDRHACGNQVWDRFWAQDIDRKVENAVATAKFEPLTWGSSQIPDRSSPLAN